MVLDKLPNKLSYFFFVTRFNLLKTMLTKLLVVKTLLRKFLPRP